MRDRRARLGDPGPLARLEMDGVAEDRAGAEKACRLVGMEIVVRPGVEAEHPGDLVELLGKMRLHRAVGMLGPEGAQRGKLPGR